ncbi:hypothetical protein LTR56_008919 [Elasticomyces elasticus]|nr:hypothetical protein LTR56_008919 [Elasticomyces elasticus]
MATAAVRNRKVWLLVAFYMFTITICGFFNSVLSVIFVVEPIISDEGQESPAFIPIGIDIPWEWEGEVVDPCSTSIAEPGCSYDLGMTALSSELITYTPFEVGGVTFMPPNGTMGLPYWAMQHFSDQVRTSQFEEEWRQYCLPVLDPNIISCTEEPFDQARGRTNSSLVQYETLHVDGAPDAEMYKIAIPNNATDDNLKYRISDQGLGTMLVRMHPEVIYNNMTIITAVDSMDPTGDGLNKDGYASLLYFLMYGVMPDDSVKPKDGPFYFVAKCEFESIKYKDNFRSSWRKVDFTLKNGVLHANVTEERCSNPRGNWTSGFDDLYFDLEGAADVLSSTDGYCKLLNQNLDDSNGTDIFSGMSRLDAIVNKMLHSTSTSWSQSIHQYAMMNQSVYDQPIIMMTYPHKFIIKLKWTATTYIGLVLALLISFSIYTLAARWAYATYRLGRTRETWNLLEPIDLMAYTLAAYQDLLHSLNTVEHRRKAMRGETSSVLKERPVWEGTQSLIGLVDTLQSPTSPMSEGSPMSGHGEKIQIGDPSSPSILTKHAMSVVVGDPQSPTSTDEGPQSPGSDVRDWTDEGAPGATAQQERRE